MSTFPQSSCISTTSCLLNDLSCTSMSSTLDKIVYEISNRAKTNILNANKRINLLKNEYSNILLVITIN